MAQGVEQRFLDPPVLGTRIVASNAALVRPYLGAVLPTLVVTGLLTSLRLVQNMVENELDLARIQRIRAYYHRRLAGEHDFFIDAVQGAGISRVGAAGLRRPGRLPQPRVDFATRVGITPAAVPTAITPAVSATEAPEGTAAPGRRPLRSSTQAGEPVTVN
ncbi:hypothetical protein [Micromonospora sp. AMSO31t]|uniref:hypothetical protein n=1 Tax=Micromonospora sp. AMSO31t TaxID=2650566 RepID=UPI00124BA986|nr:hypothetical protein [Micromonospora sp. AMSO31t]KAB1913017.1 hypothetical protein F8274_11985 [Micromonospora sp. AMSO31t]